MKKPDNTQEKLRSIFRVAPTGIGFVKNRIIQEVNPRVCDRKATEEGMKSLYSPPYTACVEQRALTVKGWQWISWVDTAIRNERGDIEEKRAAIELWKLKEELEIQASTKTHDLQERIMKLERWQEATIDRDFRI